MRKVGTVACVVFAALLAVGFSVGANPPSGPRSVVVMTISPPRVETTASARADAAEDCGGWSVTPRQVEDFFRRSERIGFAGYIHHFDTASCSVDGTLRAEGRTWQFSLNAAGKGIWRQGPEARYFGCRTEACGRDLGLYDFVPPGSI